jgi:hypothetical protein
MNIVLAAACPIPVDIALLLDSSGSIGEANWTKVVESAKALVDAYDVSEQGTHVGLISYSTNVSLDIGFNSFTGINRNAVNLKRVIDKLPLMGGKTFIDKALKLANEELFEESKGMRKKYKKVSIKIIFIFGKANGNENKNKEIYICIVLLNIIYK